MQVISGSGASDPRGPHSTIRVRLVITGLVQGVGYRYFAYQAARRCGVTGWVRNRRDGAVEAQVQGTRAQVDAVVSQLGVGPRWGHVDAIDMSDASMIDGEATFTVRH